MSCPCGSRKKLKDCCLQSGANLEETVKTKALWRLDGLIAAGLSGKECLHPQRDMCKGKIVDAHAIAESHLREIAENGHVLTFRERPRDLPDGVVSRGIHQATTFTGFCGKHDHETFKPVEQRSYAGTSEQRFLLAYRAIAREAYDQARREAVERGVLDVSQNLWPRARRNLRLRYAYERPGMQCATSNTAEIKRTYDEALLAGRWESLAGLEIRVAQVPEILAAASFFPVFDFRGRPLQDPLDLSKPQQHATASIIPDGRGGGVALLAWPADHGAAGRKLAESLCELPHHDQGTALVQLVLQHTSVLAMRPSWWGGLDSATRQHATGMYLETAVGTFRSSTLRPWRPPLVVWAWPNSVRWWPEPGV